jgi:DNA modification methylase
MEKKMFVNKIIQGDCISVMKDMPDQSIDMVVTSPPYFGLRNYQVEGQIGLEETPDEYVAKMVEVFREAKRVLKDDGTLWLNLGDSYVSKPTGSLGNHTGASYGFDGGHKHQEEATKRPDKTGFGLKEKNLIGIPWRVAFALQADGWILRQDIIWCLSGGTWVYAKTQKGEMPIMIKDLARLKLDNISLWNGEKWTKMLGISKSKRKGDEIELVLRSGERISCTPLHKFPTQRGLLKAKDISIGDILETTHLPDAENPKDCVLDEDAAWFAGLYLAEGSRADDTIQIAGHSKEEIRWERLQKIAKKFGGSATRTIDDNKMHIRLYGKFLNAIINEFISGNTAKYKAFYTVIWQYSNKFLESFLDGYLSGDGHWDEKNNRWRLGFTRNYSLERDLRIICARLGYKLILNTSTSKCEGKDFPSFRGEIRKEVSNHFNNKQPSEVIEIRKARCREVYDIGVEDEPHLYSLASGVLTHNSKRNPQPESVKDRCTKSHEYIFLFSKQKKYYYDNKAIKEKATCFENRPSGMVRHGEQYRDKVKGEFSETKEYGNGEKPMPDGLRNKRDVWSVDDNLGLVNWLSSNHPELFEEYISQSENKSSVWELAAQPYVGAHFATYPINLITPCILAGCRHGGVVYDPFMGSGTTAVVCKLNNRNYIGSELNADYITIAEKRIYDAG